MSCVPIARKVIIGGFPCICRTQTKDFHPELRGDENHERLHDHFLEKWVLCHSNPLQPLSLVEMPFSEGCQMLTLNGNHVWGDILNGIFFFVLLFDCLFSFNHFSSAYVAWKLKKFCNMHWMIAMICWFVACFKSN